MDASLLLTHNLFMIGNSYNILNLNPCLLSLWLPPSNLSMVLSKAKNTVDRSWSVQDYLPLVEMTTFQLHNGIEDGWSLAFCF